MNTAELASLTAPEVAREIGTTYRNIDNLVRLRYLQPLRPTPGSGYRRAWPMSEIAIGKRLVELSKALDLPLAPLARVFHRSLREGFDVVVEGPWGRLEVKAP